MPFIDTKDGTSLFYRDWGDGKPVVFCAGWTLSSDMWRSQMLALSDAGMRCVAYDRRGHGRSDDPGNGYDYDTLADDLAAVLTALDLEEVTLLVHGDADASIPLELSSRKTVELIANSRLEVYENAGHGLYVTHRGRLSADLLNFCNAA